MELTKELKNEIWDYCRANDITGIDDFTLKLIKQGFTIEKYGATPTPKVVEKIVEKIVEVPVEKIVERRVEVPIEMIDDKMATELKEKILEVEGLQEEINNLKLELEIEKKKNKKDIYDEG